MDWVKPQGGKNVAMPTSAGVSVVDFGDVERPFRGTLAWPVAGVGEMEDVEQDETEDEHDQADDETEDERAVPELRPNRK